MAYIGAQPKLGNFQACDAITTSATATFNLLVGGVAISPQSAQHCLVSLNGVLQAPISSYTISGSTIVFAAALTTDDSIDFITVLGDVLDLGVPSDNTVSTAKIADNAITLAKLAGGTDGNIISYDASGDPVAIATGSDGQVLTSTGAGSPPAFEAPAAGGSLVKLSATTFGTAAAAVVFNSSLITSTYDNYKIFTSGLSSSADQSNLGILMSVDNGSNFATHVGFREYAQINSGSADQTGALGNIAFIPLGSDEESDSTGSTNFEVTIYNVHDTASYKFVSALGTVKNANGNYYGYRVHGYIASNTAVNYVKVYASGGQNLDKGTVTLYGIAK